MADRKLVSFKGTESNLLKYAESKVSFSSYVKELMMKDPLFKEFLKENKEELIDIKKEKEDDDLILDF